MNALARLLFSAALCTALADAAEIPDRPLAEKGRLIFSDDFSRDSFGTTWTARIPTTGVENAVCFTAASRSASRMRHGHRPL